MTKMINIAQEEFLNDTLVLAGFDPIKQNFELLKENMRPILDEYIELNLYKFLNEDDKAKYDVLEDKNIEFFRERISNFDNILAELYIIWQKDYLENFKEE